MYNSFKKKSSSCIISIRKKGGAAEAWVTRAAIEMNQMRIENMLAVHVLTVSNVIFIIFLNFLKENY
jgi:hypothetical protein